MLTTTLPSKVKCFNVTLERKEWVFGFAQVQLLFYLSIYTNNKMSGEFAFVICFEIKLCIDNIIRILNSLCL